MFLTFFFKFKRGGHLLTVFRDSCNQAALRRASPCLCGQCFQSLQSKPIPVTINMVLTKLVQPSNYLHAVNQSPFIFICCRRFGHVPGANCPASSLLPPCCPAALLPCCPAALRLCCSATLTIHPPKLVCPVSKPCLTINLFP